MDGQEDHQLRDGAGRERQRRGTIDRSVAEAVGDKSSGQEVEEDVRVGLIAAVSSSSCISLLRTGGRDGRLLVRSARRTVGLFKPRAASR
jgi:hypothetical protein